MKSTCTTEQEAIKVVIDKFYGGQADFFERLFATSVNAENDDWLVTVYKSSIFREVIISTYRVNGKTSTPKRWTY